MSSGAEHGCAAPKGAAVIAREAKRSGAVRRPLYCFLGDLCIPILDAQKRLCDRLGFGGGFGAAFDRRFDDGAVHQEIELLR